MKYKRTFFVAVGTAIGKVKLTFFLPSSAGAWGTLLPR